MSKLSRLPAARVKFSASSPSPPSLPPPHAPNSAPAGTPKSVHRSNQIVAWGHIFSLSICGRSARSLFVHCPVRGHDTSRQDARFEELGPLAFSYREIDRLSIFSP